MVLFFAHKNKELLKTKLMKLLNYSDMVFYKENGISMSGLRYVHLPYGSVPENFDMLLGKMVVDHVAHIEVFFDNGYEKFKNFGSVDISNYSHKEKGYCSTKQGEIISYIYAKDIQLN